MTHKPRLCLHCATSFEPRSPNERYCMEHRGRCLVEGCDKKPSHRERYCAMHYQRIQKYGEPGPLTSMHVSRAGMCAVDGCARDIYARGLCGMHYDRLADRGVLGGPESKMGKGTIHHSGYRYIQADGKSVGEHRLVMELMLGRKLRLNENVHHIDGDPLNNEPSNLELWVKKQPPGQRVADRVAAALTILNDYPEYAASQGYRVAPIEEQDVPDFLGFANFDHGRLQWRPTVSN